MVSTGSFINVLLSLAYQLVWTLIILTITFAAWYIYWKTTRNKRMIDRIPGFMDWPIVGDILHLPFEPTDFFWQVMASAEKNRASGIVKLKLLESPMIFLFSVKTVEAVISSSRHIDKAPEYYSLHPWLGKGLITNTGESWRSKRHMLTPTFHFSILQDFLEVINERAGKLKDKLQDEYCDTDVAFEIYQPVTLNTLDIICSTAMGVDIGALIDGNSEYVKALTVIKHAADMRPQNPLHQFDIVYNNTALGRKANECISLVHEFAYKVIKERRELKETEGRDHTGKRRPFLDLLLDCQDEQGNHLTDKEIREEVDTFMFAGHDTTSSAISFALYLLGSNEDEQRKCQAEIDEVLGCSSSISSADLNKLTYLEWCLKESLRIFSPVPFFGRTLAEEAHCGDYTVPAGTSVYILTSSLHKDPEVFPDPEKFDPSRFSPENCAKRRPLAYIPFSAGPRNCIGQKFAMMELKIIVATLLRDFNIKSMQTRDELQIISSLVIEPRDGIYIKLTRRH